MNYFRVILLIASVQLLAADLQEAVAQPAECTGHGLSERDIHQRIKHWSGLKPFARWSILSYRLDPCVVQGLVSLYLRIATPLTISRFGVRYELGLEIKLDGASGSPDSSGVERWKNLAARVKKTIRKAEGVDTIRRFIQRFAIVEAEVSEYRDHVSISYNEKHLESGKGEKYARLVFDTSAPGGISSFSLPHADSLPVLPQLLRMIEVVSSRFPSCQFGWIDGTQRQAMGSGAEPAGWNFSVVLKGDGCPASCVVTLAPDGQESKVSASEPESDKTSK